LQKLLAAAFDLPFATLKEVREVTIRRSELQRPLFPLGRVQGSWSQTTPGYQRTDVSLEGFTSLQPVWLDLVIEVGLVLVLEVDSGDILSISTQELAGFKTLEEFKARFRFLDLDDFLARHGITTVEQLRERYHYLLTEIRLRPVSPLNPDDPSSLYRLVVRVAILIRETLDIVALLREGTVSREVLERAVTFQREVGPAEARTPFAPLLLLPSSVVTAGVNATALQGLFEAEGIVLVFVDAP
jgi:hypothetical protein